MTDFFLPSEKKSPAPDSSVTTDFFLPSEAGKTAPVGTGEDIARSMGAGAATGLIGLPGMAGSLRDLADVGLRKGLSYIESALPGTDTQENIEKRLASRAAASEAGKEALAGSIGLPAFLSKNPLASLPTSQEVVKKAEEYVPAIKSVTNYDPQTGYGRVGKDFTETVAGSLLGPGGLATKLAIGAGGGLTGAGAKEAFRGSALELPAQIAGTLVGGVATGLGAGKIAASRPGAIQERSDRIAGQIYRERAGDDAAVGKVVKTLEDEIEASKLDPDRYVKGVKPTTAQMAQDTNISNLEKQILALDPGSPEAVSLGQRLAASREAFGAEASQAPGMVAAGIKSPDLQKAFSLQGVNPQGDASRIARETIDAFEKQKDNLAKEAWKNPLIAQANMYRGKVSNELQTYLTPSNIMTKTDISRIDPQIMQRINALSQESGKTIPLLEIQAIRSLVLDKSRAAFRDGEGTLGMIHQKLGDKFAKIIDNSKNIEFGDKPGLKRKAWADAVAATKDYYQTFRPEFMAKLIAETSGGSQKIGANAVFDAMFSGKNAVQQLKETRTALGTDIDKAAGDWIVGKLTKNGTVSTLKPDTVQNFLANPTTAGIVDEIPGLRSRIEGLGRLAGESQVAADQRLLLSNFNTALNNNNPLMLSNFLSAKGAELKSLLSNPQDKNFIDAIGRSAKMMQNLSDKSSMRSKTLDKLQNGRIVDIIYGRSVGAISDGLAIELAAKLATLGGIPGIPSGLPGAVGAAVSRYSGQSAGPVAEIVGKFVLGDTKRITIERLQQAARDPEIALLLMQKPSPEAILRLQDRLANITSPMAYERSLDRPPEEREGRASGGKVSSTSIADKLITAAESAKRMSNKATEPLLRTSDESIARALEIANRHI
jgi:hypothetical protein